MPIQSRKFSPLGASVLSKITKGLSLCCCDVKCCENDLPIFTGIGNTLWGTVFWELGGSSVVSLGRIFSRLFDYGEATSAAFRAEYGYENVDTCEIALLYYGFIELQSQPWAETLCVPWSVTKDDGASRYRVRRVVFIDYFSPEPGRQSASSIVPAGVDCNYLINLLPSDWQDTVNCTLDD